MSILMGLKQKYTSIETFNTNDPKFRSTKYGVNPYIPKLEDRPRCLTKGCCQPKAIIGTHKDGTPSYRKLCHKHHKKIITDRYGVSNYDEVAAKNAGFKTVLEYRHSIHPYLGHRLSYCENKDSRLGYECVAHIPWPGVLQVDHIDGNPHNHDIDNLQTLCANCHTYKTHINKDGRTPGRKSKPVEELALRGLA